MKKILLSLLGLALFASASFAQNVTVNPGAGSYPTLKAAFDAINAGTHTGAIIVSVDANTTETATAALNSGAILPANYTSVTITPSVPVTVSGNIIGAIIKLNGADNVTIDGRIAGTGRNLTVSNSSNATGSAAIWLSSLGAGNGASNNIIRNLEIACGVSNTNANSTFGIIMCGATIGTTINGDDNDNNQFLFNRIIRARYGIVTRGVTTNLNIAPIVTDNIIGPSAFGPDEISKTGILMQADTGGVVSRNIIQFIGGDLANSTAGADRVGIAIGSEAWSVTASTTLTSNTYTITNNIIHDVVEDRTFSAVGILLATTGGGQPTNNLVANNFIYNLRADSTAGDQLCGIGIVGGVGDRVVFNSISITGDQDVGAAVLSTNFGQGIRVPGANGSNNANLTLANNSIYMDASCSTATTRYYAITGNSAAYSFGTGFENNNNFYINPANQQLRTGGFATVSGAAAGIEFLTLANWQAAYTAPQDAASIQANPLYLSNTADLHIAGASPNINAAVTIAGVTTDIDMDARPNGANPDIGADEYYALPGNLQFSSINYGGNENTSPTITVTRSGGSAGLVTVDVTLADVTATGGAACGVGVDYVNPGTRTLTFDDGITSQTFTVSLCADAITDPGETLAMTLSNPTGGAGIGANNPATLTITDVPPPLNGDYYVPVGPMGRTYPSLTNPGGIFEAINLSGATADIKIHIMDNLTGETGAIPLNEVMQVGGPPSVPTSTTVTIKPGGGNVSDGGGAGGPVTISGVSTGGGLIKLNGADNVTINGSLTAGGTDRSLTITNGNSAATVIWIASASASNGANNNTVKNCVISGNPGVVAIAGILSGSGATLGNDAEAANNNITIQNNAIFRVQNSCYLRGTTAGTDTGCVVVGNTFGSTVAADKNAFRGMLIGNSTNFLISRNMISGVASTAASTAKMTGIQTALVLNGGTIERNTIMDIKQLNPGTYGATGIDLTSGDNVVVKNNFVSDINHDMSGGIAFSTTFGVFGIQIEGGTNTKIYNNSVNLYGPAIGAANSSLLSAAFAINATTSTGCDVRDNIFANKRTGGTTSIAHVAVYLPSGGTSAMNLTENNNSYYWGTDVARQGAGQAGTTAGTNFYTTLAALQAYSVTLSPAGTNDNASLGSTAAVPFASANDLHITNAAPEANMGVPLMGVTNDIDGETRSATTPDIGADEVTPANPLTANSAVSRRTHGAAGDFDINLPLTGTVGIECRSGPNYTVIITFSNNVVSGSASVTGTGSVSGSPTFSANTMTINLTGVTDIQQITVTATNVTDTFAQVLPTVDVPMKVLIGDVSGIGNSTVNSTDVAATKAAVSVGTVNGSTFRADVNASGTLTATDVAIVKSDVGHTLP